MRNLKRVLSLALALVMVLGMMVITTSAADFTDAEEITYTEAVDVVSAIGVINGIEAADGTFYFDPTENLTREQGAALICYLLMGKTNADKLSGSGAFSDVAATRWSAGEIDYCVSLGFIAGMGDGTFAPTEPLTGIAYGKLLLCALGYDAKIEGYEGKNWATNIAVDMMEAGLTIDDVDMSAPLTRELAAQMTYQALTANMVKYIDKGSSITVGGVEIVSGASDASYVDQGSYADYDQTGTATDATLQFCEKYYGTLKLDGGRTDEFARPAAYRWYIDTNKNGSFTAGKDTTITNVMETADYTAVVKAPKSNTNETTMSTNINDVLGLKDDDALVYTNATAKMYVNGDKVLTYADGAANLAKGDEIEVYADKDGNIENVIVTRYTLAKVKSVTALTASELKSNSTSTIPAVKNASSKVVLTVADSTTGSDLTWMYDTYIADFAYARNDYVLVALPSSNDEVLASKLATSVDGTVSATKSSTYNIGGTYYSIASDTIGSVSIANNGVSGVWALDAAGKLAAEIDVTETSADYAYVYRIVSTTTAGSDGYGGTVYTAFVVLADGSKASYPIALDTTKTYIKGDTSGTVFGALATNNGNDTNEAVVAYTLNAKGEFEVAVEDATIAGETTGNKIDTDNAVIVSGKYANNSTQFVFVDNDESNQKVTVSTAVGYKNVNIASGASVIAVTNIKGVASHVFVIGTASALDASAGATLAVLTDATPVVTGMGTTVDPYVYTYSIIVGTEETELVQADPITWGTIAAGDVFYYTLDSAGVAVVNEVTASTVTAVIDDANIQVGGSAIELEGVAQYTLTIDQTNAPRITYTVTEGATYSDDGVNAPDGYNVAVYSTMAGVKAIYVINTITP